MKAKTKTIINIRIIVVIFVVMLFYMIAVDGIYNMINVLKSVNYLWVFAGIVCMIIYWGLEALCLYLITKKVYKRQRFRDSLRVSMIGQLFNCLTPFSSGGQPMQAYAMTQEGKSVSNSATILLIKFIVYQLALVIYTLVVIIFQFSYFKNLVSNFINLALIGFLINFVVIVFLILIGINKKVVINILKPIYKFLGKIKVFKNKNEKLEELIKSIDNFHNNFKIIKKERKMILITFFITIIQLTVYFLVTFMVYKAFGQDGVSIIKITSAQAFLMMIMAFVPIPGAGIAAEGGFLIIFNTFFTKNTINMAILFWRMYTFYLPIIVGAFFMIIKPRKYAKIKMEDKKLNE